MTDRTVEPRVPLIDRGSPSDSARRPIIAGLAIVAIFFGGFGTWAVTAPLNGAVVAGAVVKVEGNRKSVQHLDGGIVRDVRVREGDHVNQGDILIVLDDTDAQAQVSILAEQAAMLAAAEARLRAELSGGNTIAFPAELANRSSEATVRAAMDEQTTELQNRTIALEGQRQVLDQRIAQLRASMAGDEARRETYQQQLDSVIAERESIAPLLAKGLITRDRTLQLDRTEAGIRGQMGDASADMARDNEAIGENQRQIEQLGKDRAAQVSAELSDTRSKLLDVTPRLQAARATLDRTTVRAPYSGTVVGLAVFSVGGVVARGERILDIVPDGTPLVVEAQIPVEDISDVRPDMTAEVHFTAYKQRNLPIIHGRVAEVSADRLTDERTGQAYYKASVAVDPSDMAAAPQIRLYPGMPASVTITTTERTPLDYLLGPLTASFHTAFRQK